MRSFTLVTLFTLFAAAVHGQSKWDVSLGFSHALMKPNAGTFIVTEESETFDIQPCTADGADSLGAQLSSVYCRRRGFNGLDGSVRYSLSPRLAVRGDLSTLTKRQTTVDSFGSGTEAHTDTNHISDRTWLAAAGIELMGANGRWRPFAHVLAGAARQTSVARQTSTGSFNFTIRDRTTSFALKLGGGVDIAVTPRVDVRLLEVDYVPIFARDRHTPGNADFDQSVRGRTANNIVFGFGIVIR